MRLNLMPIALLAALLAACGGSSAETETTAEKLPGAPPPVLPLPTDPWAVLPDGNGVVTIDVAAVRASPHVAFLRQLGKSYCMTPEQETLVFDKTQRAFATGDEHGVLFVLQGTSYTDRDAELFADALAKRETGAAASEQMHKRLRIMKRGKDAVVRVGDGLIAFGDAANVEKAAAMAEGASAPRLYDSAWLAASGARPEIATSTLVIAGPSSEMKLRGMSKGLSTVGLPRDMLEGTIVGVLKLTEAGAEADARIHKANAQVAADMASALQRKLGQLSMLARLTGLPPVLDKTEARAEDTVLRIKLSATHAELEALRDRLAESLAEKPVCVP
jgi:hypothetical protein